MHKRGLILTAALAVMTSGVAVLPAAAQQSATPAPAEAPKTVTLITGDKVTVTKKGDNWDAKVEPAKRLGPVQFIKSVSAKGVTVIPSVAVPLIQAGKLDRRLFDVTGLIEQEYDDAHTAEIPLLVESKAARTLGKVTRELPSAQLSAVATPKNKATDLFGKADVSKIWLNGRSRPSLDVSVPQVGAPAAWQTGHTGAGATVAVLDSGYDPKHPDLAGIVKGEKDFTGQGIVDKVGHGTHVASTIAGRGSKYTGVAKGADLLIGKVCGNRFCMDDEILAGMQWAADSGAKIVNMSLGGGPGNGVTTPLEIAINLLSAEKGMLFVVSAGNDGPRNRVASPASADAALAVASVNKQDKYSTFSNPGPRLGDNAAKPDIAAPGEDIVAARAEGTLADRAVEGNYARLSGTSMAAPHVAGGAAILSAQHPDWTGQQIKAVLMGSANPVNATIYQQGAGRLDVGRASSQTVVPSVGSLTLGVARYPHNGPALSKPITYRNIGSAPVSLQLSMDNPAFRTNVDTITVPANGEATVTVTFDHTAVQLGVHGGRLVAKGGDTVIQTPVSAYKEPESYDLTTKFIDRDGNTGKVRGSAIWVRLDSGQDDFDLMGNNSTARLAPGRYAVMGAIETPVPGQYQRSNTQVAEPEVDLRKDTVVTLDARQGKKVSVQAEEKDARQFSWTNAMVADTGARGVGYYTQWFTSMPDYHLYAVPTTKSVKEFRYFNRMKLERPLVRLKADKPESFDVPVDWAPGSPQTTDARALPVVNVGHATPAEIAAADLKGKLAVFTLGAGEELELSPRARAIAEAGANSVLFYFSDADARQMEAPPLPMAVAFGPEGARLAKLPNASATLTGLPASPHHYELVFPSYGGIPADVTYRPRNSDLATVKTTYRTPGDGGMGYVTAFATDGKYDLEGSLETTATPLPLERTEYFSPAVWQNSTTVIAGGAAQQYEAAKRTFKAGEKATVDWGKAVIGPGITGSAGFFSPEPHLAYRQGDVINTKLPLFSDSAGHSGFADTGETVLYAGDKEIARSGQPGIGQFTVPTGAANYRLTTAANRDNPDWPLSTKVSAEWAFRSGNTTAAAPLPLLTIGFDPKLDMTNHAPRGALFAVPVRVDRQPGAQGGKAEPNKVEVSYNDGQTWQQVPLLRVNNSWWAAVQNPTSGFVSLRASASDKDGNSVTQTIIRAYRVK
ncbi:subtilisin family serine protease [Kibdelosporangium banguiense]|uniref:Subtilisin family serine protease n=1 Tax=Kibdelosporangium banguiense TaxID=1365924 RepID=A0ABS4T8Z2_9PSEU|nr:S8 family serine peptidase [Kibdelosporangium banguiense]MBP2320899.1 subtilisin family serine protease [Kibdelosporangium banguiense]